MMLAFCCSPILPGGLVHCRQETFAAMDEGIDSCSIGVKEKIRNLIFYMTASLFDQVRSAP
jgi:hypothetical protein